MGWGGYNIEIGLLLDEHAGDKEREHTELASRLLAEITAVCERAEYAEIVTRVDPSWHEPPRQDR
jgi:hypothetical protein